MPLSSIEQQYVQQQTEGIPFFTREDFETFSEYAGNIYKKGAAGNTEITQILEEVIFSKVEAWLWALNYGQEFDLSMGRHWQIAGHYTSYAWARLIRNGEPNNGVYFTIEANADEIGLKYKLDFQHTRKRALTPDQQQIFYRLRDATEARDPVRISADDLVSYDWMRLVEESKAYLIHYLPLYSEILAALAHVETALPPTAVELRLNPVPEGIIAPPPGTRRTAFTSNADYDHENRERKKIGTAGEELVIRNEQRLLKEVGREDLAALVKSVPDWRGFDIQSWFPDQSPKYIEVKTTCGTNIRPFYWTRNERNFMLENPQSYCLYRLYNYSEETGTADYFTLEGDLRERIHEQAIEWLVYIRGPK